MADDDDDYYKSGDSSETFAASVEEARVQQQPDGDHDHNNQTSVFRVQQDIPGNDGQLLLSAATIDDDGDDSPVVEDHLETVSHAVVDDGRRHERVESPILVDLTQYSSEDTDSEERQLMETITKIYHHDRSPGAVRMQACSGASKRTDETLTLVPIYYILYTIYIIRPGLRQTVVVGCEKKVPAPLFLHFMS